MPVRLDRQSADFDQRFREFLAAKREVSADGERATRAIADDVAARGDAARLEATKKFDRLDIEPAGLRITAAEVDASVAACDPKTVEALKFARDRIETFHRRQLPKDERFTDAAGVELGWRWSAVDAVGLYVPGGTAAYPSSVLMNAVPARVAGVPRVVMVVPAPDGKLNPLVLAAAHLGGVSEIYRVGGALASGQTPIGKGVYPKAPDLREAATQNMSDGELFWVIHNGIRFTAMPAWGEGDPEMDTDSWKLVHFIRHLPKLSPDELERMKSLNPKTKHELEEEASFDKFLQGDDTAGTQAGSGHHH